MTKSELSTDSGKQKIKSIPIGRIGTVDEIGDAVVFLASDKSNYITGQTLNLNEYVLYMKTLLVSGDIEPSQVFNMQNQWGCMLL